MLSKDYRIRKQKDFDRVFSDKGTFFSQGALSIKVIANDLDCSRFGFIVSNRVSKKAVARNRIKRLLREAVRLKWVEVKSGMDAVIMVRSDISTQNLADVDKAVDSLLKRSGMFVTK
jgi:ribonuclease P protein component